MMNSKDAEFKVKLHRQERSQGESAVQDIMKSEESDLLNDTSLISAKLKTNIKELSSLLSESKVPITTQRVPVETESLAQDELFPLRHQPSNDATPSVSARSQLEQDDFKHKKLNGQESLEWLNVSLFHKNRWKSSIQEELQFKLVSRLEQTSFYSRLSKSQKESICTLFGSDQIIQVSKLDLQYGLDFQDINDSLHALNALPISQRRDMLLRARNQRLQTSRSEEASAAIDTRLIDQHEGKIQSSSDAFSPFLNTQGDRELLESIYDLVIVQNSSIPDTIDEIKSSSTDSDQKLPKLPSLDHFAKQYHKKLEALVRKFCKPAKRDDPTRLDKLLSILDYSEQIKLILSLPVVGIKLESSDLSRHSKVEPFFIEFVNDALDLDLPSYKIHKWLQAAQNVDEKSREQQLNQRLEKFIASKAQPSEENECAQINQRFQIGEKFKENSFGTQNELERKMTQSEVLKTVIKHGNSARLSKLEDKLVKAERRIDVHDYFEFLQSMPVPASDQVCFVTLQGQLFINQKEKRASNADEAGFGEEQMKRQSQKQKIIARVKENDEQKYRVDIDQFQEPYSGNKSRRHSLLPSPRNSLLLQATPRTSIRQNRRQSMRQSPRQSLLGQPILDSNTFGELWLEEANDEELDGRELDFGSEDADEKSALLAVWYQSKDSKMFYCQNSYEIIKPLAFKDMSFYSGKKVRRIFLYRGQNNQIFWFSQKTEKTLTMNILSKIQERPEKVEINQESKLFKHVVEGNYREGDQSFENPVPNIIEDKATQKRFCVFTFTSAENCYPTVYFYDLDLQKEIAMASGASIFLLSQVDEKSDHQTKLHFYCESRLVKYASESVDSSEIEKFGGIFDFLDDQQLQFTHWYECRINFKEANERFRKFGECVELIKDEISQHSSPDSIGFKFIQQQQFEPTLWSTAPVLVEKLVTKESQISVTLITQGITSKHRQIRVIEVLNSDSIEMTKTETGQKFSMVDVLGKTSDYFVKYAYLNSESQRVLLYKDFVLEHWVDVETHNDLAIQIQKPLIFDDQLYIPMIMEHDGTLKWQIFDLSSQGENLFKHEWKVVDNLRFWINFPIMVYIKKDHRSQDLIVHHLSNEEEPVMEFQLEKYQFVAFVETDHSAAACRVSFIVRGIEDQELSFIILSYDKPFEKSPIRKSLSKWFCQELKLSTYKGLKTQINYQKRCFMVRNHIQDSTIYYDDHETAILFTTATQIFFAQKNDLTDVISTQIGNTDHELANVMMLRGYSNCFFFIINDTSSGTDILFVLEIQFREKGKQWNLRARPILEFSFSKIIALQLDEESVNAQDSYWSFSGNLEKGKKTDNQLLIIDDRQNLIKLQQTENGYQEVFRKNFSHIQTLRAMQDSQNPVPSLSFTERAMTVKGIHYVYETGQHSPFSQDPDLQVLDTMQIKSSNLQLHRVQQIDEKGFKKLLIVVKKNPGTRKCTFMGHKCQRDVILCTFISKEKLLTKIHTDRKEDYYWTILNPDGQILQMPRRLKKALNVENWTTMKGKQIIYGQTQLILQSDNGKVASFRFNSDGDLNKSFIFDDLQGLAENVSINSETILCSYDARLYRAGVLSNRNNFEDENNEVFIKTIQDENEEEMTCIFVQTTQEAQQESQGKPEFAICGDYFCWLIPGQTNIQVINIKQLKKKSLPQQGMTDCGSKLKCIDLDALTDNAQQRTKFVKLDSCSPLFALHTFLGQSFGEEQINQRSNMLQVTVQNKAVVFDLRRKNPISIIEMPAMHHLLDCQKYIEIGLIMTNMYTKKSTISTSGIKSKITQQIEPNVAGSAYLKIQSQTLSSDQASNENGNEERLSPLLGVYLPYCELDLLEMRRLEKRIELNQDIQSFETASIYSNFDGQSIFSYFEGNVRLLKQIYSYLKEKKFDNVEDYDEEVIESPELKKLVHILNQKSQVYESQNQIQCSSILQRSLSSAQIRDSLLQIANLSSNFSLFQIITSQEEAQLILHSATPFMIELLHNCFVQTKSTRKITELDWPIDLKHFIFSHKNSLITAEDCRKEIKKRYLKDQSVERIQSHVVVHKFNLVWLFNNDKNFAIFVKVLNHCPNKSVLTTNFVKFILELFWSEYQLILVYRMFLPFVVYLNASQYRDKTYPEEIQYTLIGVTLLTWVYMIYLEVVEIFKGKSTWHEVILNQWNINDYVHLSLVFTLALSSIMSDPPLISLKNQTLMASVAACSLVIKLYDWMRLVEATAFYVSLIGQTVTDILAFMALFVATLFMFGLPISMLNFYQPLEGGDIVEQHTEWFILDSVINQYFLSLGEFHIENFDGHPHSGLVYLFFFMATFFTQVTMLNMLIAIMSDTFDKVVENRDVYATKTKLRLLGDYVGYFSVNKKHNTLQKQNLYMFIVTMEQEDKDDTENWTGTINQIKSFTQLQVATLETKITGEVGHLHEHMERVSQQESKRLDSFKSSTNNRIKSLQKSLKAQEEKLDSILTLLTNKE